MTTPTNDIESLLDQGFALAEAGRLPEARALFEQVSRLAPDNAEAWMMLGSIDAEQGRLDEAFAALTRARDLDPSLPETFYYLANVHRSRNELEKSLECIQQAVTLDPEYGEAFLLAATVYGLLGQAGLAEQCCVKAAGLLPGSVDVLVNLGNALLQQDKAEEARRRLDEAVRLQPGSVAAWTLLGRACARLGDFAGSAAAYGKVAELDPQAEEAPYGLGVAAYHQGDMEQAASHFRQALALNPQYADAGNSLGTVCRALGHYDEALAAYDSALRARPDHAEALFGKAGALIESFRPDEAVTCLREALRIRPDYVEAHLNLASALMSLGQAQEALSHCESALQLQPANVDAAAQAARIEQHIGEVEKAYQRLQPLIAAGADSVNLAVAYGDVCRSMDRPGDAIAALEDRLARSGGLSVTGRKNLHFCLGNLYDRSGDYDKAFEHYRTGNDLRKVDWDPRANSAQVDAIIRAFSREYLVTAPEAGTRSEKPVFVLGMPRSGTSLVEQILASHPAVHGAGELTDLPQLVQQLPALLPTPAPYPGCAPLLNQKALDTLAGRYLERLDALAPDALRVVDKMPGNFSFLGLIELLFPDARVIHCVRDPVDTCLSCYFQDFSGSQFYSYDLGHLGAFYRDYARLMAHWKQVLRIPMLEVAYEELVADQEAVSRRMIEFCGLDWDERCLQFHENRRFVATSSYDQVRRPIYSSSVDRGRHYRPHLAPLIDALRAEQP